MDYFTKLSRRVTLYIFVGIISIIVIGFGAYWAAYNYFNLDQLYSIAVAFLAGSLVLFWFSRSVSKYATAPLKALSQAILHVSPSDHDTPAPKLEKLRVARELVTNLSLQVYQLASHNPDPNKPIATQVSQAQTILDEFPTPVIVSDKSQNIVYANHQAADYLQRPLNEIVGQNLYSVLDLSFTTNPTLDDWLNEARSNTVTASKYWDRVRLTMADQKTRKQLDLAAYYNKNNPESAEVVLSLFDKTKYYTQDDDAISFISLAVHELRTPLTILKGYIEVFEDEVADQLDPEMQDFMKKMQASAEALSAFVSNILQVARVEENQLFLQLHAENWGQVLTDILEDVELRAEVHNKKLVCHIENNLPMVAIDRTSMYEVINNLLENAIKYSEGSDKIIIRAKLLENGLVETTVQDFGIGIPSSIIGNLFEKFYRNHRSRAQFGGTGLGLYLCKAIVEAHGGQIWVQSKEGEGSTFGFTLQPYSSLANEAGSRDNKDIIRTAHGWIKNHSFYKR